jgi:hypothetical protein
MSVSFQKSAMDHIDLPAGKYDAGSWQYMRGWPELATNGPLSHF